MVLEGEFDHVIRVEKRELVGEGPIRHVLPFSLGKLCIQSKTVRDEFSFNNNGGEGPILVSSIMSKYYGLLGSL